MAEVAASGRTWVRLRERVLVFLGVCLPVPVLAATGLSVPLPATVERLAATLVPFVEAAPMRGAALAARASSGVIIRTPEEEGRSSRDGRRRPSGRRPAHAPDRVNAWG